MRHASVCLPIPVRTAFTYAVPDALVEGLVPGRRVKVPFGPRTIAGWFVGWTDPPEPGEGGKTVEAKEVAAVLDDGPLLSPELVGLARWIADTYACSWGEALSACVPAGVKKDSAEATIARAHLVVAADEARVLAAGMAEKHAKRARILRILTEHPDGIAVRDLLRSAQCTESPLNTLEKAGHVRIERALIDLDPFAGAEAETERTVELMPAQASALERIHAPLDAQRHRTFLLHGVTGSGKTEVYLRAIRRAVDAGRQAIVLVPEIALTPQTVARFRGWFERVAVLHSALTDAERRRQWRDIRAGRADVVIGPRSAVFAPVPRLGLVVVDEEHEPSFKQQSSPRYHARDVAVERAARNGAVVILGSATPSLESWHAAHGDGTAGRDAESRAAAPEFELLSLPTRAGGGAMPKVEIVDMVEEARDVKRVTLLSRRLAHLLEAAFRRRKQGILFLNRRGFATSLWCARCASTLRCDRCSLSMTLHRSHSSLLCHHCGQETPVPRACPACGSPGLARLGTGTERLEDAVHAVFPGVRLARMDSDSMHDRESYEKVLGAFGRGELDLLLGTQMIAKGLHFPGVVVVGVVSADLGLAVPDFRAAERTFQLVAQVAGRAGRADLPGRVVVQTLQPKHPALVAAAAHDFAGFASRELAERKRFRWPPWTRLVRIVVSSREDAAARARTDEIAAAVRDALPPSSADVLGPTPCPIHRVRDRFRWHAVIRAHDLAVQHAAVLRAARFSSRAGGTELTIDVDPADLT